MLIVYNGLIELGLFESLEEHGDLIPIIIIMIIMKKMAHYDKESGDDDYR